MKPSEPGSRWKKRPQDRSGNQAYRLDSWSAFNEYLRFRPDAIRLVRCKESWREKVVSQLAKADSSHIKVELIGQDKSPSAFEAEIRLVVGSEAELLAKAAKRPTDLIIALDHITDPRNLGAIARNAAYFGVNDIVAPERRQVLLTDSSVATAQGAFALVDFTTVVNLGRTLNSLKDAGYWIIGTDMAGEPLRGVRGRYDKVVLVMGSEDKGMAEMIRRKCDLIAAIPGVSKGLESLNVAVASGICMYELAQST